MYIQITRTCADSVAWYTDPLTILLINLKNPTKDTTTSSTTMLMSRRAMKFSIHRSHRGFGNSATKNRTKEGGDGDVHG